MIHYFRKEKAIIFSQKPSYLSFPRPFELIWECSMHVPLVFKGPWFCCLSCRCQPRPFFLCPQPAASSQPLLWQSSGTFCGDAKTHRRNRRLWPLRERSERRGSETCECSRTQVEGTASNTSDQPRTASLCLLVRRGYGGGFCGEWHRLSWFPPTHPLWRVAGNEKMFLCEGHAEDCADLQWIKDCLKRKKHTAVQQGWTGALMHSHQSVQL